MANSSLHDRRKWDAIDVLDIYLQFKLDEGWEPYGAYTVGIGTTDRVNVHHLLRRPANLAEEDTDG